MACSYKKASQIRTYNACFAYGRLNITGYNNEFEGDFIKSIYSLKTWQTGRNRAYKNSLKSSLNMGVMNDKCRVF